MWPILVRQDPTLVGSRPACALTYERKSRSNCGHHIGSGPLGRGRGPRPRLGGPSSPPSPSSGPSFPETRTSARATKVNPIAKTNTMNSIDNLLPISFHPEPLRGKREKSSGLHCAAVAELDETWAFEVAIQDRCAERREAFEWGTALFRLDMPRVHDQNLLRMERGFETVGAEQLAREADRLQRPAGLSHRKLLVPDEAAGERLSEGFAE